jgi:hypothetical protein
MTHHQRGERRLVASDGESLQQLRVRQRQNALQARQPANAPENVA